MNKEKLPVALALTLLAIVIFFNALSLRYRMIAVRDGDIGYTHVIDNWSGRLWYCVQTVCAPTQTIPQRKQ